MAQIHPLERIYNTLNDSQWWPSDRLIELQHVELTRLIGHAKAYSLFYNTRLACLFRPNGTIDWDRWAEVPIMSRADLSHQRDSIQTRRPVKDHGPFGWVKTSGSTGDPVEFLTTRILNDLSTASSWRGQNWAGMDWSGTIINLGPESHKWKLGDSMGPWGPFWMKDALKGRKIFATYLTSHSNRVDLMKKFNVDYSTFYSGIAIGFAEYLRESGTGVQLKLAQFVGGTASDYLRKEFRDVLKTEIHELYSSKEGGALASPCPLGHGWHQNAESVLLEIVDAQGRHVKAGETGRVVITPFGSTATPLIRYDQGDLAVAGPDEICPCGRTLPRIAAISGRLRHDFRRPNGDQVDELSIEARRQLGAGTWQIARVAEHSFEVRYKKRDWGHSPNMEEFNRLFRRDYYPEAQVTTIEVENFQLGPTGKHMERVDEWDPASQIGI